ncbi:MAG: outer membrane lipoprotein-sorting protein [Proteobacteria bacterium]|nr:outer membrane lipoprotein-sorting protein [Pseudomonadota bacterium]MDA1300053.1 outer membrane lipoprotein-sorting protein [Pseudomonadota bacterium]
MRRNSLSRFLLAPLLAMFTAFAAATGEAGDGAGADRARQVIDDMEQLYRGDASRADITMIVKTPQYEREMSMSALTQGDDYAIYRIMSPKKDRGISTLKREQQMWNFFPKINKVIKVPPSMMMGSWMGSDFTNDDLVKQTSLVDEYHLDLEETETEYRIKLTPKQDTVTVWGQIDYIVDKERMLPLEQTFYDDRGTKVRRMLFTEPREFAGKTLPSVLEMVPLNKAGHSTRVIYDALDFEPADVSEDAFTLRNLKSRF